jgi:outer membrane receptor protein involved in Fe transport
MRCRIFASTLLRTSVLSAGSLLFMSAAGAQEMDAPGAAAGSGDEILVTARKTAERSQDVPITLNALSSDDLRNRAAVDVKDVLRSAA